LADFRPPVWLRDRHVQTLAASLPGTVAAPGEPLFVPLRERGALVGRASWVDASPRDTVLLIHGVGGSSASRYMGRSTRILRERGYHAVSLNLRGVGEGVDYATSLYHAGLTDDVDRAVRLLEGDPRVRSLFILGFSLGGGLVLKLAGEWGQTPPRALRGLATLSAPTDLAAASDERFSTFAYRRFILRAVIAQACAFAKCHPGATPYDARRLQRVATLRDYDRQVIVPMHQFRDVQHYYASASAAPFLPKITVPTLLIHSHDDPLVPAGTVSPTVRSLPASVRVLWTRWGGHVGWLNGLNPATPTWALERVLRFFEDSGRVKPF
jgi:predicted alpha/beta-fold hydrolase